MKMFALLCLLKALILILMSFICFRFLSWIMLDLFFPYLVLTVLQCLSVSVIAFAASTCVLSDEFNQYATSISCFPFLFSYSHPSCPHSLLYSIFFFLVNSPSLFPVFDLTIISTWMYDDVDTDWGNADTLKLINGRISTDTARVLKLKCYNKIGHPKQVPLTPCLLHFVCTH